MLLKLFFVLLVERGGKGPDFWHAFMERRFPNSKIRFCLLMKADPSLERERGHFFFLPEYE